MENAQTFQLTGLNCHHCAKRVEQAVSVLPGVKRCEVQMPEQRLLIWGDTMDVGKLAHAIEKAGYGISGY